MLTTHLVVQSFFNGASTYVVPNPGNFAGYHTFGPYAHLDGFTPSDVEAVEQESGGSALSAREIALRESAIKQLQEIAAQRATAETLELDKPKAKKRVKQAYRAVFQNADDELRMEMARVVAPFAPSLADTMLPPEQSVKFDVFARDAAALQALYESYYTLLYRDEETAVMAVLLM